MRGDMISFTVVTDALGYKSNWDISDFPANSRARLRKIDLRINKGKKKLLLCSPQSPDLEKSYLHKELSVTLPELKS